MSAADFVSLAGGLTVPRAAFDLLLDLERRDILVKPSGELLRVSHRDGSKPTLSAEDVAAITKWKRHLIVLAQYEAPPA